MRWREHLPTRERLLASRWLRWLAPWLGDARLWRWSRRGVALGVALGVFFGLLVPLAQIPLTAVAAVVLRANLPAAAASTLVTNPVTFAPIYYGAYQLGAWVTGETTLPAEEGSNEVSASDASLSLLQRIQALGKPLLAGLLILASVAGLLAYALVDGLWRLRIWWRRRRQAGSIAGSGEGR